ncbi:MAG: branched-chain amino acid ABC transporter permease [Hyphomicrobiales bacterium]
MELFSRRFPTMIIAVLAAAAAIGPLLDEYQLYLLSLIGVYVVFALGYNLLMGYAGQFDFGQGAFLGIGAYATAILEAKVGMPVFLALPLGGIAAVIFGVAIGVIVLRLQGFYLALVTLGFNQTVVLAIALWTSLTGGFQGMSVPRPSITGLGDKLTLFYIVAGCSAVLLQGAVNLTRSRIGLAFQAIREGEIAAQAMGIDLTRYRVLAYAVSAFYGGIAGGLLAMLLSYITPDGFGLVETLKVLTMITVGGMGSIAGSVIGATVLTLTTEFVRIPGLSLEISNGLLLMVFVMLMPAGIQGLLREIRGRLARRESVALERR